MRRHKVERGAEHRRVFSRVGVDALDDGGARGLGDLGRRLNARHCRKHLRRELGLRLVRELGAQPALDLGLGKAGVAVVEGEAVLDALHARVHLVFENAPARARGGLVDVRRPHGEQLAHARVAHHFVVALQLAAARQLAPHALLLVHVQDDDLRGRAVGQWWQQ